MRLRWIYSSHPDTKKEYFQFAVNVCFASQFARGFFLSKFQYRMNPPPTVGDTGKTGKTEFLAKKKGS